MAKFISIFMVLAFVMTTSFPAASHVMMMSYDSAKAERAKASDEGDCHKHAKAEQSEKTARNDKDHSGKCCDKGMCKCIGSTCHSGLSKIFNNGNGSLFQLASSRGGFTFTNDVVESALSNRLKRPPKA